MREIATNPVLKAEAGRALAALADYAKRPAGEAGVTRVVGPRMAIFPVNLPEEAMDAWWADYYDALADLPEPALEAGMRAHIRSGASFMPKPGELRTLALSTENRAVRAAERARAAVEYQPPRTYEPTPVEITPRILRDEPTEAAKAAVRSMAADYVRQVEERPDPLKAPLGPPIQAKVDDTGISDELRALRARQTAR